MPFAVEQGNVEVEDANLLMVFKVAILWSG